MSLYADYIKEKSGHDTYETEDGFITYQVVSGVAYGRDFYVKPEVRAQGGAKRLWKSLREQLVERGVQSFITAVNCQTEDATTLAKLYLTWGSEIKDAVNGNVIMEVIL